MHRIWVRNEWYPRRKIPWS